MIERDQRYLLKIVKKNRKINLQKLYEEFITFTSKNICIKTIRNFLHEQGFYGQIEAKKPFISETNRKKRLAWAKERKEQVNKWENIIWSDEFKFELFRGDDRRQVWRRPDERYNIEYLNPTIKSG